MKLPVRDVLLLSLESHVHYHTIDRYYRGGTVRAATLARITEGARKLRIPLRNGKVPPIDPVISDGEAA